MIVGEVEGVDRIRVGGQRRHILVHEDRGVGPRRADGGTVSVHGIAGDATGGRRPREGDPRGGDTGGLEAGGRGGGRKRCGGGGMEDGAHRVPVAGRAQGGRSVLGAGERDARVVGDASLQERGRGDGYGDGRPTGGRLAVLAIVKRDVPRVVLEAQRPGRARPRAVHVVRYLNLRGSVVLGNPPDQQIPLGDRLGECDRDRRDPRPGRERGRLDEGRRGRLGDGRAGEEDSQDGDHGKARTGVGRGQKFHGNSLLYKGENENQLKLG